MRERETKIEREIEIEKYMDRDRNIDSSVVAGYFATTIRNLDPP